MDPDDPSPPDEALSANARVTPMMEQYVAIRAAHPDCLLFYRMGDFYELFFDDAVSAAQALGITLTRRGRHLGAEIPMCGVPVHAADDYLHRLIALGHRVAVCEQTEDPAEARKRGGKSVVRRAVTRLVTPGTLTEERLLEPGRNNYLAALARIATSGGGGDRQAAAWLDISTGEFRIGESGANGLAALLARIGPSEVLVSEKAAADPAVAGAVKEAGAALTALPAAFFDAGSADSRLCALYGVRSMEAFGTFSRAELAAAAALVAYVDKTQMRGRPPIEPPRHVAESGLMRIDAATRANLELFRGIAGGASGSLIAAIDRTRTAAGARLLADRLANPLCDVAMIQQRLDAVGFFVDRRELCDGVRDALRRAPDIKRALARLGLDRGGPRDLDCIRAGLDSAVEIARLLRDAAGPDVPAGIGAGPDADGGDGETASQLANTLREALADELPLSKRDGNFVRPGCDAELDEARRLRDESRRVIAALQARYAEAAGIRALKIRHNNVLGYFVEVAAGQGQALLDAGSGSAAFIHRQTLASAMRFTTLELGALEEKIANAAERALALELAVFDRLAAAIAAAAGTVRSAAETLAEIDVATALAELAATEGYVRPRVDDSLAFAIAGGRHPVVEQALRTAGQGFVGNDADLGPGGGPQANLDPAPEPGARGAGHRRALGRIVLVTGPNMAGKSTFLRQNALIAILAQSGSFVPAASAHIGVVDAVFSRVGAADDLARGRSTFMVEMVETAAILNQAGPRSLVILDEIGRGTATFDGLSIAWASVEHLHDTNGCRALFATHYHELTALSARLPRLVNATMKVKEWKGDVVFLHQIVAGAADRSYGIQVARLAGLPKAVIARARQVLDSLEKSDRSRPKAMIDDLPLFAARPATAAEPGPHPALAALDAISPDELSPREALEAIYALKRLRRE